MLALQYLYRRFRGDPVGTTWMMIDYKTGKGLSHYKANIKR